MVALGDGRGEVAIGGHHDESHVRLGGTGDHILDEVAVAGRIDDGVVPLLGEELLWALKRALTLFWAVSPP